MGQYTVWAVFMIDWDTVSSLAAMIGVWIAVMAIGMRQRKDDSPKLILAKRIFRHTFTATLVICVLMAAWALVFTRYWK